MRPGSHAVGRLAVVAFAVLLLGAARVDRYVDYLDSGDETRPHPHPLDEPACRDCAGADAYAEGAKLLDRPGAEFGSDCAAAVPLFLDAAAKGNVAAARALGFCYWYGNGVTHVRAEAIRWYRIPASAGEPEASFRLGNLLFEEAGSAYPDPTLRSEANAWWQKAADAGHPRALYTLAKRMPDPARRFALMQRAANAGLADAEYAVARAYIDGAGVAKDEAKGRLLLERLDAGGRRIGDYFARADASAYIPCTLAPSWTPPARPALTKAEQERLAQADCDALHFGIGVARDERAAFACYQAQEDSVQLAIMYANGYGTARDLDAALHYACLENSAAPAEHEALASRIAAARKGEPVEPFDFCDIATSGYSDAICADRAATLARQANDEDLARVRDQLSQSARTTLARLRAAADRLITLKSAIEAPTAAGGHAAARLLEAETANRAAFVDDVKKLAGRNWPYVDEAVFAQADRMLNKAYRGALHRCPQPEADDAYRLRNFNCDDLRAEQRAWIRFRDLFAKLAAEMSAPGTSAADLERAARVELTRQQTKWLDSLEE